MAASTPQVFPRFLADLCYPAILVIRGDSPTPIGQTLPRKTEAPAMPRGPEITLRSLDVPFALSSTRARPHNPEAC
jgi:hypothetical protein